MSKHRKNNNPEAVTLADLGHAPRPKPPTAYETFAALGVIIALLAVVAAVGALIAAVV
ncbi:hypothetical protein GR239_36670 [Rhizobium leguminosarum]|uniref:hypothetical protein n=1 Tax=Rhizobium ruizarguesonis TaxID=2081791 RepID=UPI0013B9D282|nr:hypothetical protein [Rhizobium ruizarguesonis]NEK06029.1 hypothetical protein [Rhizobium ruizarguesonis]